MSWESCPGFGRPRRGSFTRRAFKTSQMDLTAVEGLADLVFAETEAQTPRRCASIEACSASAQKSWRQRLIGALALVEAGIDFSDEADVPQDLLVPARHAARELLGEIGENAQRRTPGRAPARGPGGSDRRAAECRQVEPAQPVGAARGRDRVAPCGNHPRRYRSASRPRRLPGDPARHRRGARRARIRSSRKECAGHGSAPPPRTWCCGSQMLRLRPTREGVSRRSHGRFPTRPIFVDSSPKQRRE